MPAVPLTPVLRACACPQEEVARKPFQFLLVAVLREYLERDLRVPTPFPFDKERVFDDFGEAAAAGGGGGGAPGLWDWVGLIGRRVVWRGLAWVGRVASCLMMM